MNQNQTPSLACNLLPKELEKRIQQIEKDVFSGVQEIKELPDGYAFCFPTGDEWIAKLSEFIIFEKKCCPFFTFELIIKPHNGPTWLYLRGSFEIKTFIEQMGIPGKIREEVKIYE